MKLSTTRLASGLFCLIFSMSSMAASDIDLNISAEISPQNETIIMTNSLYDGATYNVTCELNDQNVTNNEVAISIKPTYLNDLVINDGATTYWLNGYSFGNGKNNVVKLTKPVNRLEIRNIDPSLVSAFTLRNLDNDDTILLQHCRASLKI